MAPQNKLKRPFQFGYFRKSLRLQLIGFIAIISTIVLACAGYFLWHQLLKDANSKFDWEILSNVMNVIEKQGPPPTNHPKLIQDLSDSLNTLTQNSTPPSGMPLFLIAIRNHHETLPTLSSNWPRTLPWKKFIADKYDARTPDKPSPHRDVPPSSESLPREFDFRGFSNRKNPFQYFPTHNRPLKRQFPKPELSTFYYLDNTYRTLSIRLGPNHLKIGINNKVLHDQLHNTLITIVLVLSCALMLIILGCFFISRVLITNLAQLTHSMQQTQAQNLSHTRIDDTQMATEFKTLIGVYNEMLNRLDRSFKQANRFSADAAHELKTPLTILQGELDHALKNAPDDSPEQLVFIKLLNEVAHLHSIIRKLLLLAKADSGQMMLEKQKIDLIDFFQSQIEDIELIAPSIEIKFHVNFDPSQDNTINVDLTLFHQAIQNLLDNARKYNVSPHTGWIEINLKSNSQNIQITISNPINPSIRPDTNLIFDRFYRADTTRQRSGQDQVNLGLGLSITREIIRSHGGNVTATLDASETVITFLISMPRQSA